MTNEELIKLTIESCGIPFKGFMRYPGKPERDLVLFDDSRGSTLGMKVSEFTIDKLKEKLKA